MDGSLVLNLLALTVSGGAFLTSALAARRQLKLANDSNVLPVIIDAFKETRTPEFFRSMEYIRDELRDNHPTEEGYRNLPEEIKDHIRRVGLFYDDIGKLVAHNVVDEELVLGAYGRAILRTWDKLAPFVYSERERHRNLTMFYFEDLAWRAKNTTMQDVHRTVGLRRLPPA
ncbi:DUF4760 domain-containing protein [Streptomyces dioscori]|nr:DUF4760 domain-containing protein [Streptomyces dioscori]